MSGTAGVGAADHRRRGHDGRRRRDDGRGRRRRHYRSGRDDGRGRAAGTTGAARRATAAPRRRAAAVRRAPACAGASGRGGAAGTGVAGHDGRRGHGGSTGTGNNTGGNGFYRLERLNRGVVAVAVSGGVYVGWRMFGFEYDSANPSNVSYNVYRSGTMVGSVTNSTNYLDSGGTASSTYTVRAVIGGIDGADSESATVWAQQYLRIPLMVPPGGTTPSSCPTASEAYTYSANDASIGDLDGDGGYEIILKWDPSNAKDNSQSGCTGNVFIDAYKLNGTRLWRIDLGPNIRAGAHYTQFVVFDSDGDGKAEMAVKTAPGTQGRHRRVPQARPRRQRRRTPCSTATRPATCCPAPST